jgi:hypothetical protein
MLRSRTAGFVLTVVGLLWAPGFVGSPSAQAQDARKILKAMSDYMAAQKSISVAFDSDIEVMTSDLQKIQFTSSGRVQFVRPNKLHARRVGGYKAIEIIFDGKTLTISDEDNKSFAQIDSPGSIDQLVDRLRNDHGVIAPGADLLFSTTYDTLTADVIDAKHIGLGVIDGVECEHLAFRAPDIDWQIWIAAGTRPIPCKYVITSKAITGAPQYTLRIKQWQTDVPADAFVFKPPQGAKKVALETLENIDEVPPGIVAVGGVK